MNLRWSKQLAIACRLAVSLVVLHQITERATENAWASIGDRDLPSQRNKQQHEKRLSQQDFRDEGHKLLFKGDELKHKIQQQILSSENFSLTIFDALTSAPIEAFERDYKKLSQEFIEYDRQALSFIVRLNTTDIILDPTIFGTVIPSQVSNQRDWIRQGLAEFREIISAHRATLSNRLSLFTSMTSAVTSILAIALVFIQIRLMKKQDGMMTTQNKLATEQLEISKRQDETARLLFSRRPALQLVINDVSPKLVIVGDVCTGVIAFDLNFGIYNDGDKSARELYAHVFVPNDMQPIGDNIGHLSVADRKEINGIKFTHWRGQIDAPIYPKRAFTVGKLPFRTPAKEYKILWQIICDDGEFPAHKSLGEFHVTVKESKHDEIQ